MHPGAGIAPGCIFGGAIPRLKLTYESMGPFGRKALADFEHDVVTSGRSREGCCDSSISGPIDIEWYCTRALLNDSKHFTCGTHRDILPTRDEELPQ